MEMDVKQKLASKYDNIAIYTSGFYADPEDALGSRSKLMETLKSLTMNQHADTPFSLQIMTTNGEINVMPLGLLSLDELKKYENDHRKKAGLNAEDDSIPMVIQFAPHTEHAKIQKQIVGTTNDLFDHFNDQFPKIWAAVSDYLDANQAILTDIERDLLTDAKDVQSEYLNNFKTMTPDERKQNVGYELKDEELDHFSHFMADMHEIQAVVMSAASFTQHEIMGDNLFTTVMNDRVLRNTFFWVLDNTFYEIMYYFIEKTRRMADSDKIIKHLRHQKKLMIINMRNDAFERAQKALDDPKQTIDLNHYFTDIFIPVAEQFSTELDKLTSK